MSELSTAVTHCTVCSRAFSSQTSYFNHLAHCLARRSLDTTNQASVAVSGPSSSPTTMLSKNNCCFTCHHSVADKSVYSGHLASCQASASSNGIRDVFAQGNLSSQKARNLAKAKLHTEQIPSLEDGERCSSSHPEIKAEEEFSCHQSAGIAVSKIYKLIFVHTHSTCWLRRFESC